MFAPSPPPNRFQKMTSPSAGCAPVRLVTIGDEHPARAAAAARPPPAARNCRRVTGPGMGTPRRRRELAWPGCPICSLRKRPIGDQSAEVAAAADRGAAVPVAGRRARPGMLISVRTARLHGPHDLRQHDEDEPAPAPGQSLIAVTSVGLCGSDLHWFETAGI